jgi:hypothetical protein
MREAYVFLETQIVTRHPSDLEFPAYFGNKYSYCNYDYVYFRPD